MKCTHSEAEQDVALVDGMCPLCLADELFALRERVAKLEHLLARCVEPVKFAAECSTDDNSDEELLRYVEAALKGVA